MQIQCPKCHEWLENKDNFCPLCGASLDGQKHDSQNDNQKNKKKIYHSKWFWIASIIGVCFVVWIAAHFGSSEADERQSYFQMQKQVMQAVNGVSWYKDSFDIYTHAVNPDCLWYYENIPHPITRETVVTGDKIEPTIITKHQQNKCANGKDDKLLRAWHLGEDDNNNPICYTDSLHPPKGVHDYEPGQFRLSFMLDSNHLGTIESLSDYCPGYPEAEGNRHFRAYFASDSQKMEYVIGDIERELGKFNIYAQYIKGGKYLHVVFPVMHPNYSQEEKMFFYVYRVFSLDGIEICGEWAKSKQWAAQRMGDSP